MVKRNENKDVVFLLKCDKVNLFMNKLKERERYEDAKVKYYSK